MAVKVGINGFGRIGRQVLKAIRDYYPETLEVVAFNDIGDMKTMAHLLKYDSTYGRFNGTVEMADDGLLIDGTKVKVRGNAAQSAKFIWPARSGSSGAKITVLPNGGETAERTFPGTWGLFKMIDAGSKGMNGGSQFDLTWNVGTVQVRATLRAASANNPFQRALFRNLRAPQNLQR